jgi:hypothetical protein
MTVVNKALSKGIVVVGLVNFNVLLSPSKKKEKIDLA